MRRDQDDDINDDEDEILQDGHSIRVPISFMDAEATKMLRQKYRGHRPGWRMSNDTNANDDVADAHAEYCQWLRGAHRAPVVDDEPHRPTSLRDARAARCAFNCI